MMVKPVTPVLKRNSSIGNGLIFSSPIFEKGGNPQEVISKTISSRQNSMSWNIGSPGPGVTPGSAGGTNACFIYSLVNDKWKLQSGSYSARVILLRTGSSSVNYDRIFHKNIGQGTNAWGFLIRGDGTNKIYWIHSTKSVVASAAASTTMVEHYVVTWDGSNLIMYINGKQDSITTLVTEAMVSNTNNVIIGSDTINNNSGGPFNVYSADLWNRVLSPQEVRDLYINPWSMYVQKNVYQPLNALSSTLNYGSLNSHNLSLRSVNNLISLL